MMSFYHFQTIKYVQVIQHSELYYTSTHSLKLLEEPACNLLRVTRETVGEMRRLQVAPMHATTQTPSVYVLFGGTV